MREEDGEERSGNSSSGNAKVVENDEDGRVLYVSNLTRYIAFLNTECCNFSLTLLILIYFFISRMDTYAFFNFNPYLIIIEGM
jgi:hypothetical protein